jgi:hypothetical protein
MLRATDVRARMLVISFVGPRAKPGGIEAFGFSGRRACNGTLAT